MTEPRQVVDFEGMLDQLRRMGFTMAAIERCTEIPRTSLLNYLVNGATPLHPSGERLVEFYCRVTGTEREALKMGIAGAPAADVWTSANSYFGLFGQASHSHRDRARLAGAVLARGHCVDGGFSKAYRKP